MTKTFYITTPIYYVNDAPHIGHAYTSISCDVIARFMRLDGHLVRFLTGTDEHGQKVAQAAEKSGISPQNFVDIVSETFRNLLGTLNISADDFIRTTQERHKEAVQHLWTKLFNKGDIYLGKYAGWYSVRDEAFFFESDLIEGKAPTGAEVIWVEEESYFFRLSKFQEPLLRFYKENPDFIGPKKRMNEAFRFVEGGLKDLSVSRTSFTWGIPVPNDPKHVMYVWLDALTNYLTATGYPEHNEAETLWPADIHMIGKDILRFHAVYWPAFLMAADLPLPKRVFAHGWWTNEGEKISKTIGNVIDPIELVDSYGLDAVRYFLMKEIPFGNDGDFSRKALVQRVNSELSNKLGNLVQRVLSLIMKNCSGVLPTPGSLAEKDENLLNHSYDVITQIRPLIQEDQSIHKVLQLIWDIIDDANKYIDESAPWSLKKTDFPRMETVLYTLAETIRCIGILIQPFMPNAAGKILELLNVPGEKQNFSSLTPDDKLLPQTKINAPTPIFPRIEEV